MEASTVPPAPAAKPAGAVANASSAGQASGVPANPSASSTASLFGGLRGGRKRADGLKPGTPEALAADKEKDRIRKARARDSIKAANPSALPSAVPDPGAPALPAVGVSPVPSADPAGVVVPWDQGTLKPLFDQLIPTIENLTVGQITGRAAKAKLPKAVLVEVEKDARWSEPSRKAISIAAPRVAAKWLNKTGISSENQDELVLGTAIASILTGHVMLLRKLDKLIASQNAAPVEKPPEPKEVPATN